MNLSPKQTATANVQANYEKQLNEAVISLLGCKHNDVKGVAFRSSHNDLRQVYQKAVLLRETNIDFVMPLRWINYGGSRGHLRLFRLKDTNIEFVLGQCEHLETFIITKKGSLYKVIRALSVIRRLEKSPLPVIDDDIWQKIKYHTIDFAKSYRSLSKYGCRLTRGIILAGPPGNGKTMVMRYLSSWALSSGYDRYTPSMDILERNLDCLNNDGFIFLDDFDINIFSSKRTHRLSAPMLSSMDGMTKPERFSVRIFSTNEKATDIDPAFKRPGRIDEIITIDNPSDQMRTRFFTDFLDEKVRDALGEATIESLIEQTSGKSFSELTFIKDLIIQDIVLSNKRKKVHEYIEIGMRNFPEKKKIGWGI